MVGGSQAIGDGLKDSIVGGVVMWNSVKLHCTKTFSYYAVDPFDEGVGLRVFYSGWFSNDAKACEEFLEL